MGVLQLDVLNCVRLKLKLQSSAVCYKGEGEGECRGLKSEPEREGVRILTYSTLSHRSRA
jgi:hypothetical protein